MVVSNVVVVLVFALTLSPEVLTEKIRKEKIAKARRVVMRGTAQMRGCVRHASRDCRVSPVGSRTGQQAQSSLASILFSREWHCDL
jgi:hypothetical protein